MHLTLHLTDRCNLACRYCYQRHGASDMPRETAEAAIDRLATGNNPGIVFFGGEPLLRKDLMLALVDRCEAREPNRFHYKVTTNGTLLDEDFLAEAGRRRLAVALSCDGVRAAHDAFRVDAA
ncbi:MAG: radical SAM protein, partial [Kiritimatiellae bacterium]|nr:radical SAM protein [Kiritimatiellia bacterium]